MRSLGRYALTEEIGRGSMGTAYARVMADRNRGRIAFLCRNVRGFGTSNFVVDTRTAAETIFEEFAHHLLGVPSQFLQLATRSLAAAS